MFQTALNNNKRERNASLWDHLFPLASFLTQVLCGSTRHWNNEKKKSKKERRKQVIQKQLHNKKEANEEAKRAIELIDFTFRQPPESNSNNNNSNYSN